MLANWRSYTEALRPRIGPPFAVAVLFLILPLALYATVTLGGKSLVPYDALVTDPLFTSELVERGVTRPQNGLVADLVFQNDVWKQYIVDSVTDGEAPLWNPNVFGGVPFLAAGQHSALYPSTVLFLALSRISAFGWAALLTLWLAAIGMYLYGRSLGLGRFAAALMGLAWSLSTLFVANVVFPMIQAAMAWTPLLLAGMEWTCRESDRVGDRFLPRGRATAALILVSISTSLIALAGHAEALYYAALIGLCYSVFRIWQVARRQGIWSAARPAFWIAVAALAGALLAGVQLVPLAELARTNWRGDERYEAVVQHAYGIRQVVTFFVPDFYGNPAHHSVWDISSGRQVPLAGDTVWGTSWGAKNYVEAAAYAGAATLVLAALALLAHRRRRGLTLFLCAVGAVSLSFAFGLPTYRLLFVLPGIDQLHTPFRWVFPFLLALVTLAGIGAEGLSDPRAPRYARYVGPIATAVGAAILALLAAGFAWPDLWIRLVDTAFGVMSGAEAAGLTRFPDMESLASYEFWNLLHLAIFVTLAGVGITTVTRSGADFRSRQLGKGLLLIAVGLDLFLVGFGFNPSNDPELAQVRPSAMAWLQETTEIKWGRVVGFGQSNVLWPNTAQRFSVPDLRGYDSIIPWWTVETINAIEDQSPPDGMLLYNRIGNLQDEESLDHPTLSSMGVRYVVSTGKLSSANLRMVYTDNDVFLYERIDAMPRAWLVNRVQVVPDRQDMQRTLDEFDPTTTVILEEEPSRTVWRALEPGRDVYLPSIRILEGRETRNSLEIEVYGATTGDMLVLSEAWFPGWRAWVETAGEDGVEEVEVPIYRANGAVRAIPVPQGLSRVHLRYFPMSVKVGLYCSFLGAVLMLLAVAYALWCRFVRVDRTDAARLVAVNSVGPMAAALLNKVLDFVFAMLYLRVLGPENAGRYYTAIVIVGFVDIFTNFGLNLLAAREVAKRPRDEPRYVSHTAVLRLGLWVVALPILAGYVAFRSATGDPLAPETILAVALLTAALIPSNLNATITSIFQARERMVLPAGVTIVSTFLKISSGALVLLAGYGFVGLAAVSIGVNWATFLLLAGLALKAGIRPGTLLSSRLLRWMVVVSLPLMLNHLLQTVFFKIDVLLLDQLKGEAVVGWYSAAYKWIDALLIIPAYSTMALFPLLSRRAANDREGLTRAFVESQRWLVSLALPIALVTTILSELLVQVLAGTEYLPHGSIVLQIMVWFLPLSFVNGLTQYVLIALDRQRWITVSFTIAASFNIVANLIVIPIYGYKGAAVVTIISELVLMLPFRWKLKDLDAPPLLVLVWRPAIAASVAALVLVGADAIGLHPLVAAAAGVAVYCALLYLIGGITDDDRRRLRRLMPGSGPPSPESPTSDPHPQADV